MICGTGQIDTQSAKRANYPNRGALLRRGINRLESKHYPPITLNVLTVSGHLFFNSPNLIGQPLSNNPDNHRLKYTLECVAMNHEVESSNLSGRANKSSVYDRQSNTIVPIRTLNRLRIGGGVAINESVIPMVTGFAIAPWPWVKP